MSLRAQLQESRRLLEMRNAELAKLQAQIGAAELPAPRRRQPVGGRAQPSAPRPLPDPALRGTDGAAACSSSGDALPSARCAPASSTSGRRWFDIAALLVESRR